VTIEQNCNAADKQQYEVCGLLQTLNQSDKYPSLLPAAAQPARGIVASGQ